MEDRLKSGVKEVLTVNIFDTVKKIFVAGSADKGGGPSLEDRMDGFWLDTDMTPFWTCVSRPPSPVSVLCCSRGVPEGGTESAAPLARQHIYPNVINQIDIRGKSQQAHALWLMSQAADSISDSDLVQQQIRGAQNWGLLPLYGLTATAKVGLLAGEHNARPVQPQFPTMLGQISKGNKRARILRELAMHTSAKFSGGANGLRMDYFSLLRQRLTQPLVQVNFAVFGCILTPF